MRAEIERARAGNYKQKKFKHASAKTVGCLNNSSKVFLPHRRSFFEKENCAGGEGIQLRIKNFESDKKRDL